MERRLLSYLGIAQPNIRECAFIGCYKPPVEISTVILCGVGAVLQSYLDDRNQRVGPTAFLLLELVSETSASQQSVGQFELGCG